MSRGEFGITFPGFILSSIFSFLAFATVVRWYKFITRYKIGYFAILAPAVMLVFQSIFMEKEKYIYSFTGIIVFLCLVTFINLIQYHKNYALPAKTEETRIMQYFAVRGLYSPYRDISDKVIEKDYKNIGFLCGIDSYEYPFWKVLENSIDRWEHVCVMNETAIYDDEYFFPDCIISVDVETEDTIEYHKLRYKLILDDEGIRLFECQSKTP